MYIDLQEAQKFIEQQLDYDYSAADAAAAAPQKSTAAAAADLLWYDYGGGGGSIGAGSPIAAAGALPAVLISSEKRGDTTQSSAGGMWFGPRLGRRKRRGGSAYSSNNGVVLQPLDGNAIGSAAQAMAAVTTAAEQAVVSDMINSAPWVLVPIMENSREHIYLCIIKYFFLIIYKLYYTF